MKARRTYTSIRIDFTPFVSIALLLIVFFVWVKMVEKPRLMQMNIPGGIICCYGERLTADANLFLLGNDRIGFLTYQSSGVEAEFVETDYSVNGLRNQLMNITRNHYYGAIIVVTPTRQATFKNLVDVFDELKILGHLRFVLNYGLTPGERKMLANYTFYRTTKPVTALLTHVKLYPRRKIDFIATK